MRFDFSPEIKKRQLELSKQREQQLHQRTDQLFCVFLAIQSLAGISVVLLISFKAWSGIWLAFVLGNTICGLILWLSVRNNQKEMMKTTEIQTQFQVNRDEAEIEVQVQPLEEITEDKTVPSSDESEKASEIRNEFVAAVSHKIRTPMNGVLGMLELLLDTNLTNEQRDLANTARLSAESLLDIFNEILDYSKLEAGKLVLEPIPPEVNNVRLPSLLQPDIRNLRILVLDENEVSRDVLQELLTSWGMRNDSVTGLQELIEDLQSASRAGDPYDVAIVSVADSEIGILAQNFKANPALRTTKLILLGSITNRDSVPRESRFEACLAKPFRASQLMDVLSGIVQERKQMIAPASQQTKFLLHSSKRQRFSARVLVVEDNIINQKVAKHNLERLGCSVNVAGNGKEAVEIINVMPYDLVFMDCEMPVLDGFEATQQIRKLNPRKNIPIIAMTARALKGDREKCLAAGMDAYLSKPVSPEDFESILKDWAPQTTVQEPETFQAQIPPIAIERTVDVHISRKLQDLAEMMEPHEIASLIDEFLGSCRQYISGMKHASSQSRPDYLRMHAHSLKGSSLYIGANRIADLCAQLEKLGINKDMGSSKALITRLENEFEIMKAYLQQEKSSILKMPAV